MRMLIQGMGRQRLTFGRPTDLTEGLVKMFGNLLQSATLLEEDMSIWHLSDKRESASE